LKPLDSNRLLDTASQGLAADAHSLDALKRTAARDPKAALKGAAQQFEALFLQMVLKSMREAIPKSGLLDSDSEKTYTSMLDQQLATSISKSGTGLADVIAKQLGRYVVAPDASDAKKTPAATPAPAALAPRAAIDRYVEIAGATPNVALRGGAQASSSSLGEEQRSFLARMQDHAAVTQQATGIPANFVLGQAALESGWGKREIRDSCGIPTYNLFGIKAGSGWQGRTVDVVTTEYENGMAKQTVGKFRAYNNYLEAFRDWAQLITGNKRYAEVVDSGRAGGNVTEYANGLARAGYATDPDYGAKLARVIGTIADMQPGAGAPANKV
jgi:flagellar protein FlgJ